MIAQERQKIRHLLVIKDRRGKRAIPLTQDLYSLGRSQDNSIVLYGSSVSRQHATIARRVNSANQLAPFEIIDGNLEGTPSTNGLLINGVKRDRTLLHHGDIIELGHGVKIIYYTLFNFLDREFTEFCQTKGDFQLIEQSSQAITSTELEEAELRSQKTSIKANTTNVGKSSLGLASFAQLIPHPIIEIDLIGSITYLNPAAIKQFPQLQSLDCQHPIITGLPTLVEQHGQHFTREIEFQSAYFEQSIQYFQSDGLIRIFMTQNESRSSPDLESEACDVTEITERQQKTLLQESDRASNPMSDRLLQVIVAHDSFDTKIQSILEIGCDFFNLDLGFLGKLRETSLQITTICDRQDYGLLTKERVLEINKNSEDRSLRLFQLTLDRPEAITLQKFERLDKKSLIGNHLLFEKLIPITTYLGIRIVVAQKTYGIVAFVSPNRKLPQFSPSQMQFINLIAQCLEREIEQKQIELVLKKLLKQKNYSQQIAAEIRQPINELIEIVRQLDHSNLDNSQHSLAQAINSRSENLLYLIQHLLAT